MELERLSLAPAPVDDDADGAPNGVNAAGDDGCRAPRLPRWTRQEILVLIQGKKVAESRVRRGRTGGIAFGSAQIEPKWASVSSYCKRHGVNRGPVQCRKRWSNLAGDYKKIKEWESQIREESESFWVMRNDVRREKRLPGFFDREVYDMLDGVSAAPPGPSALALGLGPAPDGEGMVAPEEEAEAVFDSGRSAAAEDGLFSDFEQSGGSPEKEPPALVKEAPATVSAPVPISEKQYQPFPREGSSQGPAANKRQPASNPEMASTSQQQQEEEEGQGQGQGQDQQQQQPPPKRKRKRFEGGVDEGTMGGVQDQLIEVLERNGRMLSAQLEAQNTNFQLDREQRKDQADCLVAVLSKLADALGRIADKL